MCVCVLPTHICWVSSETEEGVRTPGTSYKQLGTKPGSSGRAGSVLNHWTCNSNRLKGQTWQLTTGYAFIEKKSVCVSKQQFETQSDTALIKNHSASLAQLRGLHSCKPGYPNMGLLLVFLFFTLGDPPDLNLPLWGTQQSGEHSRRLDSIAFLGSSYLSLKNLESPGNESVTGWE